MITGEKAKQIIDKFLPLVEAFTEIGRLENAKKCASIAVDEIISMQEQVNIKFDYNIKYWQEVKQEIENYEPNI